MLAWLDERVGVPTPVPGTPGDPGLFGPGSAVWRIGRERLLLAAGPAALLMQIAHPLVAAGVADHSRFGADPFERLRATLHAVLTISYGDRRQADAAAAAVRAVHAGVRGRLPADTGPYPARTPYDASDPSVAMWVHATLVWSALEARATLVGPISTLERDRYYQEAKRFAALFGVGEEVTPAGYGGFERYFAAMLGSLVVGDQARDLAARILEPVLPHPLRGLGPPLRAVTAGLLPARLRTAYGLPWDAPRRALFRSLAISTRTLAPSLPPRVRFWPHYLEAVARTGIPGVATRVTERYSVSGGRPSGESRPTNRR